MKEFEQFKGISCSLSNIDKEKRILSVKDLFAKSQSAEVFEENSAILHFSYDPISAHQIFDLLLKEQSCCSFFVFSLSFSSKHDILKLTISANKEDADIPSMFKSFI